MLCRAQHFFLSPVLFVCVFVFVCAAPRWMCCTFVVFSFIVALSVCVQNGMHSVRSGWLCDWPVRMHTRTHTHTKLHFGNMNYIYNWLTSLCAIKRSGVMAKLFFALITIYAHKNYHRIEWIVFLHLVSKIQFHFIRWNFLHTHFFSFHVIFFASNN